MKAGFIGRFKPLHNGATAILLHLVNNYEFVKIAIGSSNMPRSLKNPFTAIESKDMIMAVLKNYNNYSIHLIPDFGHIPKYKDGNKWKETVKKELEDVDYIYTGNEYVKNLLENDFKIKNPLKISKINVKGSLVRYKMAKNENISQLVPKEALLYLQENNLIKLFREKYGADTIIQFENKDPKKLESLEEEKKKITG